MPKSKEQKRAEAIQRGKILFAVKHAHGTRSRFATEQDYLDLFRPKAEIIHREHNLIYDENGYLRPALAPPDEVYSIDCIGVSRL